MIHELRASIVTELETEGIVWPCYDYKPDDLGALPAVVVDRPSITVNVQHHVVEVSVVVIGRRDGTADAQYELDEAADRVAHLLAGPRFSVDHIEPSTATVAELTYPAYAITVTCGVTYC